MPASVEPSFSFPAVVVSRSLRVEPCSVLLATSDVVLLCCRASRLAPTLSSFTDLPSSTSLFSVRETGGYRHLEVKRATGSGSSGSSPPPSPFFSSLDFCSARSARKCSGDWDSGGVTGALPASLPGLLPPPPPPLVSTFVPPWSKFCREPGSAFSRDSLLLWFRTFCST